MRLSRKVQTSLINRQSSSLIHLPSWHLIWTKNGTMGPPRPIQQNRLLLARLPYRHWLPYDPASRPLQEKRMPNPVSRRLIVITAAIVIAAAIGPVAPSSAQSYPDRPIRFFVPFPAGCPTHAVARRLP